MPDSLRHPWHLYLNLKCGRYRLFSNLKTINFIAKLKLCLVNFYMDCNRNFKRPSMQRWQCPIHNDTLKNVIFVLPNVNLMSMFITFKTGIFCKSSFRISTSGKHRKTKKLSELNTLKLKYKNIFDITVPFRPNTFFKNLIIS